MSKPSNQELASLIDTASNLLARQRVPPATLKELRAAREKIKTTVKMLDAKDPHNDQLGMLKKFKLALKIRMDVVEGREQAEAN